MMLILKLPILYLAGVCYWAIKAEPEPRPLEGARVPAPLEPGPDRPPSRRPRRPGLTGRARSVVRREPHTQAGRGHPREHRAAPYEDERGSAAETAAGLPRGDLADSEPDRLRVPAGPAGAVRDPGRAHRSGALQGAPSKTRGRRGRGGSARLADRDVRRGPHQQSHLLRRSGAPAGASGARTNLMSVRDVDGAQRGLCPGAARAVPREPRGGARGVASALRERRRRPGRVSAGARPAAGDLRRKRRSGGRSRLRRAAGRSPRLQPRLRRRRQPARRGAGCPRRCKPAPTARGDRRDAARRRRRCDGADQGLPDARASGRAPRPARLRARRRPGARAGTARPEADTPELQAQIPASVLRVGVEGETLADVLPKLRRDLLRDDRLRDRAHLRPPGARLAAAGDRDRPLPRAALDGGASAAARAADRRSRSSSTTWTRLPRAEAVLDRRPRRAGADARRGRRARSGGGRARDRDRHGAPGAPERPRPHHRPPLRGDPARVRGRAHDRGRRRDGGGSERRRQVPPRCRRAPHHGRRASVSVLLAANPSHLEAVDPVVEGITRAEQTDRSSRDG